MEIKENRTVPVTTDVLCDVCSSSTATEGVSPQFGVLSAHWGYGSQHDGERYEVHLCESCFFRTLAGLRRERMVNHLFDQPSNTQPDETFGLAERDSYLQD